MVDKLREMVQQRARMTHVLTPHLGRELALECASDITRAVAEGGPDPHELALRLLREVGLSQADRVSAEVARAFHGGSYRRRRETMAIGIARRSRRR